MSPQATSETQHQHNKPSTSLDTDTFHLIVLIVVRGFLFTKLSQGTGFTQMSVVFLQGLDGDPKRNITGTGVREVS